MPHWNQEFPRVIYPHSKVTVYVEFAHTAGYTWEDDSAWVDYQNAGTTQRFTIRSRHNYPPPKGHNPNIFVTFGATVLDLGWEHNGAVGFIIT